MHIQSTKCFLFIRLAQSLNSLSICSSLSVHSSELSLRSSRLSLSFLSFLFFPIFFFRRRRGRWRLQILRHLRVKAPDWHDDRQSPRVCVAGQQPGHDAVGGGRCRRPPDGASRRRVHFRRRSRRRWRNLRYRRVLDASGAGARRLPSVSFFLRQKKIVSSLSRGFLPFFYARTPYYAALTYLPRCRLHERRQCIS